MKLVFLAGLSFFTMLSMEPPRVAVLENYTLGSNDGQEVTIPGNVIRELAPGLAEKFRVGYKEVVGRITIPDLDGRALQNFKQVLELTAPKENALHKENDRILAATQKEIEKITFPVGQEAQEREARSKLLMQGMASVRNYADKLAGELKTELEQLPEIGDLNLFNEIIKWGVPSILELAFAQFLAEQIDIKDGYAQLKDLDPRAQLLYLHESEFSVEAIMSIYEWVAKLAGHAATLSVAANKEVYDSIQEKLAPFTAQNIIPIIQKHPHFKNIFEKLEFKNMGDLLRQEFLKEDYNNLFIQLLRAGLGRADLWSIIDLGDKLIGLSDDNQLNNLYNFVTHNFESFFPLAGANKNYQFALWGPDKIIKYSAHRFVPTAQGMAHGFLVYDKNSQLLGAYPIKTFGIREIVPVDANHLLLNMYQQQGGGGRLVSWDLQVPNKKLKTILNNVIHVIKISHDHCVVIYNEEDGLYVGLLHFPDLKFIKRKIDYELFRAKEVHKINNNQVGIMFYKLSANRINKYLIIDIPTLNFVSYDISNTYMYGYSEAVMLSTEYIIERFGSTYELVTARTNQRAKLPWNNYVAVTALDSTHVAAINYGARTFIIQFIPQTATLAQILDEIQKKVAPQQQPSQQSQKRPAVQEPERPIPAAAQGLKPAAREAKQPRLEKPNG